MINGSVSLGHQCSSEHITGMSAFNPAPDFDYYYKACRKGDPKAKAVAVSYSSAGVLADASEITGLPKEQLRGARDSGEEFEELRPRRSP
jgi:hypothetical protein